MLIENFITLSKNVIHVALCFSQNLFAAGLKRSKFDLLLQELLVVTGSSLLQVKIFLTSFSCLFISD